MPLAPAARAARTTASSCSGRSESPGSTGAIATVTSMPASASRWTTSSRGPGLGGAPDALVERRDRNVDADIGTARALEQQVEVADDHRAARDQPEGVRRGDELLEARTRQPVAAFARLVRIGGGADDDVLTVPGPTCELAPEDLPDVDLDADRAAVAVVRGAVGAGFERADIAKRAPVRTAHVGVERPLERHAANAIERRAALLLPVSDAHPRRIEHTFVPGQGSNRAVLKRAGGREADAFRGFGASRVRDAADARLRKS
jgi:hypothetical protein